MRSRGRRGAEWSILAPLAGSSSSANAVNAKGQIVGASEVGDAAEHAVLWQVVRAPDGRMFGAGHIDSWTQHDHFVFRVAQMHNQGYGRLEYRVNHRRRCSPSDDDYDRDRTYDGDHDRNYGRDHRHSMNRFEATSTTSVTFSDDPGIQPAGGSQQGVDTVRFSARASGTVDRATPLSGLQLIKANLGDIATRSRWLSEIHTGTSSLT